MAVYDFSNYRDYVIHRVQNMPRRGRGEFRKMSLALGMHTSSVSQVFKGQKQLTLEQGALLASYLGLNELEADYLLNLIEKERAGNSDLKERIKRRLHKIKEQAFVLKKGDSIWE